MRWLCSISLYMLIMKLDKKLLAVGCCIVAPPPPPPPPLESILDPQLVTVQGVKCIVLITCVNRIVASDFYIHLLLTCKAELPPQ